MPVWFLVATLVAQQPPEPPATFESLLTRLASSGSDQCGMPPAEDPDLDYAVFHLAEEAVTQALNARAGGTPKERAAAALQSVAKLSASINKSWPDEDRFHFELTEVAPLLVAKMSLRSQATFSAFGVPEKDGEDKPTKLWQVIYTGAIDPETRVSRVWIEVYPLHRGPAGRARFLVKVGGSGCAGSWGFTWHAYEWHREEMGDLDQFIEIKGAQGLGESDTELPSRGKPRTEGSTISLPYCWWSAVDTWDNPTLCAADSYDLSRDHVRFVGRVYNHPDLVAVAKAVEYAQARDYRATRGYCGSPEVALELVRSMPPNIFAGDIQVKLIAPLRERIGLGDGPLYQFDIEKRGGRWVVVSFAVNDPK